MNDIYIIPPRFTLPTKKSKRQQEEEQVRLPKHRFPLFLGIQAIVLLIVLGIAYGSFLVLARWPFVCFLFSLVFFFLWAKIASMIAKTYKSV